MKVSLLFTLFLTLLTIGVVYAVADFSLGYNPQNGNANYMLMYTYKNDGPTAITGVNGSFDLEVAWVNAGLTSPRQGGFNNGLRYSFTTGSTNLNSQGWPDQPGTSWGTLLDGDLLVNDANVLVTDRGRWLSDGEMDALNLAKRNRTFSLPDIPAGEELTFVWFGDYANLTPPLTDMLAAVDNFVLTGDTDGDLVTETLYAQDFDAIGQAFLDDGLRGTTQSAPDGWRAWTNFLDSTNLMVVGDDGVTGTFILGYYAYGGEPPADNQGPLSTNVTAMPNPAAIDETVSVTALVDDSATGNSNVASATYVIYNEANVALTSGPMAAADGAFDSPTEDVSATFAASDPSPEPGVYTLCVSGFDNLANPGPESCVKFVVYDQSGGFVTGGGWIWSPVNTNLPFMQVEGKANFGFVSKYKKGASVPTGNTQFQFKAGDLKFRSTSYDWLVVTGNDSANYKGHGTVNGQDGYRFRLWAGDGSPDTFHLKIWSEDPFGTETVVYDNGMHQPIDGGSIVVHKK